MYHDFDPLGTCNLRKSANLSVTLYTDSKMLQVISKPLVGYIAVSKGKKTIYDTSS